MLGGQTPPPRGVNFLLGISFWRDFYKAKAPKQTVYIIMVRQFEFHLCISAQGAPGFHRKRYRVRLINSQRQEL